MKTCNKCNTPKELSEFKVDPRNKSGLQGICRDCNMTAGRELRARRALAGATKIVSEKTCNKCNKCKPSSEFFRDTGTADLLATICKVCKTESSMAWRAANREQYNENQRKQHAKNYTRNRLYRYDLTPGEYNGMLLVQDNKCAICNCPPQGTRPLVIDHNHDTEAVRGLLCYGCNRALHVLENVELLAKAQGYLKKHQK